MVSFGAHSLSLVSFSAYSLLGALPRDFNTGLTGRFALKQKQRFCLTPRPPFSPFSFSPLLAVSLVGNLIALYSSRHALPRIRASLGSFALICVRFCQNFEKNWRKNSFGSETEKKFHSVPIWANDQPVPKREKIHSIRKIRLKFFSFFFFWTMEFSKGSTCNGKFRFVFVFSLILCLIGNFFYLFFDDRRSIFNQSIFVNRTKIIRNFFLFNWNLLGNGIRDSNFKVKFFY